MNILAIDTSSKFLSLALLKPSLKVLEKNILMEGTLSARIIPSIKEILKKGDCPLEKVDLFAVGLGPGSFTSLRVGLATIKGFCFAHEKPVIGVGSLDIIAMNAPEGTQLSCVINDARRGKVYACLYEHKGGNVSQRGEYLLIEPEKVSKLIKNNTLFLGDGLKLYKDTIKEALKNKKDIQFADEENWYPQARNLITLALVRLKEKRIDDIHNLTPLYLYEENCQVQK